MNLDQVVHEIRPHINGELLQNEPLKKYTTWRIGGPADILVFPTTIQSIQFIRKYASENQLPLTTIGNGSNLLVKDGGVRGIVMKLTKLKAIAFLDGKIIKAQSGTLLPVLVNQALDKGLTGLEFGAGIPASVGGATVMNAGTYQGQMADLVQEVKVVQEEGKLVTLTKDDLNYSYRYSSLKGRDLIVVETTFRCQQGSVEDAKKSIKAALEKRKVSQPLNFPSAGSVFKNPPGDHAGRLIEAVGLKGYRQGNAQIAEKHANFILNLGTASAGDVLFLMEKVQNLVHEKFGIMLEPEVRIVGV